MTFWHRLLFSADILILFAQDPSPHPFTVGNVSKIWILCTDIFTVSDIRMVSMIYHYWIYDPEGKTHTMYLVAIIFPGGALNFFSGRGVRPRFPKCGACELILNCLWKGGLVNWKFPNLGACELKISKFGGLWAENFQIWGLVSCNLGKNWGCRG